MAVLGANAYVDCDVEEPNGHLFLKPSGVEKQHVTVKIPVIDQQRCDGCQKCVDFCNFNALAYVKRLLVFADICHSCGGCALICPNQAIQEKDKIIGTIQKGYRGRLLVISGFLNEGEASGVPIIKRLITEIESDQLALIDCPPGSACTVMESIQAADYCLIVLEPTVFGLHNFQMVFRLATLFQKPIGVVINKYLETANQALKYCHDQGINVIGTIPYEKEIAYLGSNGAILVEKNQKYYRLFASMLKAIKAAVAG